MYLFIYIYIYIWKTQKRFYHDPQATSRSRRVATDLDLSKFARKLYAPGPGGEVLQPGLEALGPGAGPLRPCGVTGCKCGDLDQKGLQHCGGVWTFRKLEWSSKWG